MTMTTAERRAQAREKFMARVHEIVGTEGITPSALHAIKKKLVALALKPDRFSMSGFEMPVAQGRNHPLLVEDGMGTACT